MRLCRDSLEAVRAGAAPVIGFWGAPPRAALEAAAARFPGAAFYDLDVHHGALDSRTVPSAYCHIIRNCVDNALALGDRLLAVVAATGEEKCDAGRLAARLVAELAGVEVIRTVNPGIDPPAEAPLCDARGPLKARVVRIMEAIVEPLTAEELRAARAARREPTHGFWGTPPYPMAVLDLFPDTTRVFGWTRCVERGRPADLDIEAEVPSDLPIVFFSQGFCAKAMLARRLAAKHRGMHVDVHDSLGAATMAKIEAFLRLSSRG
jgi:hypothetical protein